MFHFLVFQHLLKQMLKTDGVSARFLRISTHEMLKTREYTLGIHNFNKIFNIHSARFQSFHCIYFVNFYFARFHKV